ncbi:hypothetical protein N7468_000082 [Penicillium chermesinum]|uniref:Zn(2)-C6 fungal-type domain-containing protein n=1 Tax=Penicillium chermesinum TaxID=63820 RepID=A0A9W9U046_9EURO|nr:uncharacterized protein N7468_000082 [Penicillium chermesinum]KAJ5248631.1 hypothetical protein N7468_000082 [Penicillium chermesinum]
MEEGLENAPRRKRVSRACDRCRSKKDKCDGIRPTCSACQASGLACCYDPHAKKRGLPEGYVRGLEKLWALSICNIEGFEETMMAMLGSTAESAERREKVMAVWADENSSESLHETWKSSRLLGALEKMLSNPETSSFAAGKRARNPQDKYLDCATGNWGFRVGKQTSPLGPDAPRIVTGLAEPSGVKRPRMAQTAESRGSMQTSDGFHALQLPPQSSQLLDLYFAATHSWFPIIAKHNILRASYLYANSPFSSRLDSRADMSDSISLAKDYYTVARNLIPSEKDRYELGHVQALLLLALVNTGLDDWTAAWLLSGQAVRMALAMELGTNSNAGRSDDWRQGKAVFLGCFVIDSLLSFRLGHCPALSAHDIAATGLLEEDGLEEWNSWADVLLPAGDSRGPNFPRRGPLRALSCFNRLVELATALNKIARNLSMGYTASTFAQQLVMDLKQWDDFLPLGCRLIGPESIYPERHSALLPHQSYLGLLYVATLLWLYLHLVPDEQNIDRLQRPATEGAQQLLCRASLMLSLHVENFPMCRLPPILEFGLRTIPEQALSLRQSIDPPNAFPFSRWADDFRQKIIALAPTWPVYDGLIASMEQWQANDDCTRPSHVLFSKKPGSSRPTGHEFLPPSTNAHGMSPTNGDVDDPEGSRQDEYRFIRGSTFRAPRETSVPQWV